LHWVSTKPISDLPKWTDKRKGEVASLFDKKTGVAMLSSRRREGPSRIERGGKMISMGPRTSKQKLLGRKNIEEGANFLLKGGSATIERGSSDERRQNQLYKKKK